MTEPEPEPEPPGLPPLLEAVLAVNSDLDLRTTLHLGAAGDRGLDQDVVVGPGDRVVGERGERLSVAGDYGAHLAGGGRGERLGGGGAVAGAVT